MADNTRWSVARRAFVATLTALALVASACGGGDDDDAAPSGSSSDTTETTTSGEDDADDALLVGVEDVLPDDDLTLADDVVVVRSDDGKAVKSFGDDGSSLVIDGDAEGIDDLAEGDVLLLTGVTVVRVESIETDGDDVVVTAAPVTLPEVIQDGELEWDEDIELDRARLASWGGAGDGDASSAEEDPTADGELSEDEVGEIMDGVNDALEGESYVDLGDARPISYVRPAAQAKDPEPYTVKGKIGAQGGDQLEYEVTYTPSATKPRIAMQVGFGSDLKGTVGIDVTIDKLASSGNASIVGGKVEQFELNLDELAGEATLEASVQALENVASAVTKPFLKLPFQFEVPVVIGGIPFTFSGESTIQVNLSMAIAGSTMGGKAEVTFGGPAGFKVKDAALSVFGQRISEAPNLLETVKAAAKGPVGLVYTTELPKFGLGFGFANVATAKVFISNGAVVSFHVLPMPAPCTATNIAHVVAAGVEADFLGLNVELGRKAISDKRFNYQVPTDARCNAG